MLDMVDPCWIDYLPITTLVWCYPTINKHLGRYTLSNSNMAQGGAPWCLSSEAWSYLYSKSSNLRDSWPKKVTNLQFKIKLLEKCPVLLKSHFHKSHDMKSFFAVFAPWKIIPESLKNWEFGPKSLCYGLLHYMVYAVLSPWLNTSTVKFMQKGSRHRKPPVCILIAIPQHLLMCP